MEPTSPLLLGTSPVRDTASRLRAGEILERILLCSDHELAEAALTSIIEVFRDEPRLRELAWPFLGPTAREWTRKLAGDEAM